MMFDKLNIDYMNMIREFSEDDFNAYVHTGPNTSGDKSKMVGRLVQVRKKAGIAGSDKVLLRHPDGDLTCHENQCFVRIVDEEDLIAMEKAFEGVYEDSDKEEYTCYDKFPATGFIVEGLPESDEVLSFSMTIIKDPS